MTRLRAELHRVFDSALGTETAFLAQSVGTIGRGLMPEINELPSALPPPRSVASIGRLAAGIGEGLATQRNRDLCAWR